jgi:hypothetical protein
MDGDRVAVDSSAIMSELAAELEAAGRTGGSGKRGGWCGGPRGAGSGVRRWPRGALRALDALVKLQSRAARVMGRASSILRRPAGRAVP